MSFKTNLVIFRGNWGK